MKRLIFVLFSVVLLCLCACGDMSLFDGVTDTKESEKTDIATDSIELTETADTETDTEPTAKETETDEESTVETELEPTSPSILDFLKNALLPVGNTMYVWGGGWNEADDGAGTEAVTIGVSPKWEEFASLQTSDYDYKTTRYQIHDGLDCSGYIGWAVYNTLETENGRDGYVISSTIMAEEYAKLGLGSYAPAEDVTDWKAGDIMSRNGHAWIVVGMCGDGSVLLLHSSPPGVMFSGTALPNDADSEAVALAERIMSEHFPEWYAKFPDCKRSNKYLTDSSAMRWDRAILHDDEGLCDMSAEEIVSAMFE